LVLVSKRVVLLLLVALLLVSILVRYPLVEHERYQTDSYMIHFLSKSINDHGYARWTLNPLSYVGYYPFSYPSGVPFLMAEVSAMTGLSVEVTILVANMAFAVIFCLGVFALARQFLNRNQNVLLATFLAIMGARFVDTTYWDGSARAPMVILVILVVFTCFRASSMSQRKLLIPAILLVIGCFAMHHMAVLLVLFGIGYILAAFQVNLLLRKVVIRRRVVAVAWNASVAVAIITVAFGFFSYFTDLTFMNYRKTSLFNLNSPIISVILNMAVAYANQVGFILLFAVLAIPGVFRESHFSITKVFPITLTLAFLPVLANSLYVSMLLSPFIAILGVSWIGKQFSSPRRRRLATFLVIFIVASSAVLPLWSSERWNERIYIGGDKVEVDERIYSDSAYLKAFYGKAYSIANVKTMWIKLSAISDTTYLASGIPLVVAGEVDSNAVHKNFSWSSANFPTNLYIWFEYTGEPSVDFYVQSLMVTGMGFIVGPGAIFADAKEYFSAHKNLLVTIDNNQPSSYVGDYAVQPSALTGQLRNATWQSNQPKHGDYQDLSSYAIYSSALITIYAVQLPL
jgi:hypothetical protein